MRRLGLDIARLAYVLADLPVELVGRIRSDRVLRLPKPPRLPGTNGRPSKHGPEIALNRPATGRTREHVVAGLAAALHAGALTASHAERGRHSTDRQRRPGVMRTSGVRGQLGTCTEGNQCSGLRRDAWSAGAGSSLAKERIA